MSGTRITRRAMMAGTAAALALPQMTGCTRGRGKRLEIAVPWSGGELDRFREVLDGYRPAAVDVTSAGNDIDAFLRARHRAGNSPDIALLSRPGLLPGYVDEGWLEEIPETPEVIDRFPGAWRRLLEVDGTMYGIWIKGAHKSLFWQTEASPLDEPASWGDLVDQVSDAADAARRHGGPAPLAIGAADGWVLTDWLENLLVSRTDGTVYDALARGDACWDESEVFSSFGDLFDLWSVPGAFPGGPGRALLTQYEESILQVFAAGTASAVFEGDFVAQVIKRFARKGEPEPQHFRFPSALGGRHRRPLLVGGDAAVLMSATDEARRLLDWLAEADSFESWIDDGGFLTPNQDIEYSDDVQQALADELVDEANDPRFDLSDLLAGPLGGGDGQGSWRILQDFFVAATEPGARRHDVVTTVTERLNDAARRTTGTTGTRGIDPDACR